MKAAVTRNLKRSIRLFTLLSLFVLLSSNTAQAWTMQVINDTPFPCNVHVFYWFGFSGDGSSRLQHIVSHAEYTFDLGLLCPSGLTGTCKTSAPGAPDAKYVLITPSNAWGDSTGIFTAACFNNTFRIKIRPNKNIQLLNDGDIYFTRWQ